ncbi:hypothetical protein GHK86_00955 [Acidimicrobiaceae bacterium USS-CC1]|uniref:Solute-binding protein family 5 domain-containing protein n=1 Tax=Acidiferrimicrobium australe TaxID=2664430 RepID=A0ABW9QPL9_9ACTN|nr:hypothetical protein [Acidiferrimicrobium australe]
MSSARSRSLRLPAVLLAVGLLAAACGSATGAAAKSRRAAPARATAVAGGTATYALQPTDTFNWIFPYESSAGEEPWVLAADENMWMPLYFEGSGNQPTIDQSLSLAYPPVFSDHDRTITIRLKPRTWSDGKPVTTRDVQFALDLLKAGESRVATYTPGQFPDNVASVDYVSRTTFVLHMKQSYSQQWLLDDELVQIFPMPQHAWDRESAGGPVGNDDLTPAGAKKVFDFLYGQSEHLATYATNPLWKVVDGAWYLTSYSAATGQMTMTARASYRGPQRPHLHKVVFDVFTSDTAEVDALRNGTVDYGYIPYSDLGLKSYFQSHGYTVAPWNTDYVQDAELGYTGPYAKFVKQLYIRQALQHLIDERLYLDTALHHTGQLTYGPAPDIAGDVWASPQERTDPDPYSVAAAAKLLDGHGWKKGAGGYLTCRQPGTGARQCGAGIAAGTPLRLLMDYTTPSASTAAQAEAFATAAKAAGVDIVLAPESATTMFSVDGVCPPGPCNFAIALYPLWFQNYGDMSILPIGDAQYAKGNYYGGGYYSPRYQQLLQQAVTHSGISSIYAAEDYLSRNVASLWFPTGDNQISVVSDKLHGWRPQQVFGNWLQSRWYFTKAG